MESEAKWSIKFLAKVGIVAYGIVHLLIGWLALQIAFGSGGGEADNSGAIETLKETPVGTPLLWVLVVGLGALCVWQLLDALVGADVRNRHGAMNRAKHAGRAIGYAALAFVIGRAAVGSGGSSAAGQQKGAGTLLQLPGGQLLLGAAGLVIAGLGVSQILRGLKKQFYEDLDLFGMRGMAGFMEKFGMFGWAAKGVATTIAGLLVIWAAWKIDPGQATGIDGALKTLADGPFGSVLLGAVAVGLIAFGLFCFGWARSPRLSHHNPG